MSFTPKLEVNFTISWTGGVPATGWVDITAWLRADEEIGTSRGRSDEMSAVGPSTFTATLDNLDGRFTPENPASPYWPTVTMGVWIRYSEVNGATVSYRFTGLVDSWTPTIAGPNSERVCVVEATDQGKRWARQQELREIYSQEVLLDRPICYYPLDEDGQEVTSAANVSAIGEPSLTIHATGTLGEMRWADSDGPTTSDSKAPFFQPAVEGDSGDPNNPNPISDRFSHEGKYLANIMPLPGIVPLYGWDGASYYSVTLECWARVTRDPLGLINTVACLADDLDQLLWIYTNDGRWNVGHVSVGGVSVAFGPDNNIGAWAHIVVTLNPQNPLSLYVNGTLVVTANAQPYNANLRRLFVGGGVNNEDFGNGLFYGQVAHVAAYQGLLSPTRILEHYRAGITGMFGERSDQRVGRILKYLGADGAYQSEQSISQVSTQDAAKALEMIRIAEVTEQGLFFLDGQGRPTFYSRTHRYSGEHNVNLDASLEISRAEPTLDDAHLANDVTVKRHQGEDIRTTAPDFIALFGTYAIDVDTISSTKTIAIDTAIWITYSRARPHLRGTEVTVDILTQPSIAATVLAVELGDALHLTNPPPGYPDQLNSLIVEGISGTRTNRSHVITFHTSPNPQQWEVYQVGVAGKDELDTSTARLGF